MNNSIGKPIGDALNTLIKNNNRSCYINGWVDGCAVGLTSGVLFGIGGMLIFKGIYGLGKEAGKKELIKKAKDTLILKEKEEE